MVMNYDLILKNWREATYVATSAMIYVEKRKTPGTNWKVPGGRYQCVIQNLSIQIWHLALESNSNAHRCE